jgi:hypothetical protein
MNQPLHQAEELLRHPEYAPQKYSAAIQLLSEVLTVVDAKNEVIKQQELEIENLYQKLERSERLV